MVIKLVFVLSCILNIQRLECANILGVFPFAGKSHYILENTLMKLLADKGHNVTAIVPYYDDYKPKIGQYNQIVLDEMVEIQHNNAKRSFEVMNESLLEVFRLAEQMSRDITNLTLLNPAVQSFLKSNSTFDVVIVECFMYDALNYFAYHFKAPLISFSSMWFNIRLTLAIGNPLSISYLPTAFNFSHRRFFDRMKNLLIAAGGVLFFGPYYKSKQNAILRSYFPDAPDIDDINVDLGLIISHPSITLATPHVPNLIEIGGFHVRPPKKLPNDLQQLLDEAKDGVIYFSFGTIFKGVFLTEDKRQIFLKCFGKLKQKVLWKWENETMLDKPANVEVRKWLPQQDILAHPNIKLFITHGGFLSITETVYHGVPILVIPIIGDQVINAAIVEKNEYGVVLPFSDVNEEFLDEKLNEVLNNGKYRENIKQGSAVYHDRPNKPDDLAVYWIEYVIRHKGAKNLRIAGLDLSWYQNLLLDVLAFIVIVLGISIYIIKIIIQKLYNKCKRALCKTKTE